MQEQSLAERRGEWQQVMISTQVVTGSLIDSRTTHLEDFRVPRKC